MNFCRCRSEEPPAKGQTGRSIQERAHNSWSDIRPNSDLRRNSFSRLVALERHRR